MSTRQRKDRDFETDEVLYKIRQRLLNYFPGSRLPGHRQLARLLGTSERNIRRAIQRLADEGVLKLQERGGTFVRSTPHPLPIQQIHIVTDHAPTRLYAEAVLLGASRGCEQHRLPIQIDRAAVNEGGFATLRELAGPADPLRIGWVLLQQKSIPEAVLFDWLSRGVPHVVVDGRPSNVQVNLIYHDRQRSIYEATNRLIEMGHRRIKIVGIHDDMQEVSRQRLGGFEQALAHHQLPFDDSMVLFNNPVRYEAARTDLLRTLTSDPRPTALVAVDQEVGCAVIKMCDMNGLTIPDDISVISAGLHAPINPDLLKRLSCFDEGMPEQLGELAVDMMVNHHRQPGPTVIRLGAVYVERGSVASPPA